MGLRGILLHHGADGRRRRHLRCSLRPEQLLHRQLLHWRRHCRRHRPDAHHLRRRHRPGRLHLHGHGHSGHRHQHLCHRHLQERQQHFLRPRRRL